MKEPVIFKKPNVYTTWDLHGVATAEVIFAYMEKDNPSGYGLSLEIGYALGKGKLVIFVNESTNKHLPIVEEASSVLFKSLEEGLYFLSFIPATTVYLCGGMHSGWQKNVIEECYTHTYIDPTNR